MLDLLKQFWHNAHNNKAREKKMLQVKKYDYDLEFGFMFIVVKGKNIEEDLTIQCCLEFEDGVFLKKISKNDNGYNDGICKDINARAFKQFGEDKCMEMLFKKAQDLNIDIIN